MSSKFFNNTSGNTLFEKLKGIASGMATFDRFLAVVGFFRSSGYFKLRKELGDISEIKILIGINTDDIFRSRNPALLMMPDVEKAKEVYRQAYLEDIREARYAPEIEEGLSQLCDDLRSGRLQIRIHASKNLHAKFYLCLPKEHSPHSDGWVIMGSSNISESGLGITLTPRYELNVALKDYDDVHYCHEEFEALWSEAVELTGQEIEQYNKETHIGRTPTPYELYIKVLIETFGEQVEDDFRVQLPEGVMDLKYQKDAVIQGYQMLMQHNGLFLADVVGLGKTLIATMIAQRFIEANGKNTQILVVYPPALEHTWKKTFQQFGIARKAQFITNGSLSKILQGRDQYKDKEEFDLIIVDEAHGFRNDSAGKYDELQRICKSPRGHALTQQERQKKVILLSATPLNNCPDDILNLLLLFQNSQGCTLDGIPNLKTFFTPLIQQYKRLMRERGKRDVTEEVNHIYDQIRTRVIDKVTVRRTRNNILKDPDYHADIHAQGIVFPKIEPPRELVYEMDTSLRALFYNTLTQLTDGASEHNPAGTGLHFARYRAVEFLENGQREKYRNAEHTGQMLAGIFRVLMVKRLESSFYAFKKSLHTLLRVTTDMLTMFDQNRVIIAPKLRVKELQAKGMELDQIIEYATSKGYQTDDILFPADAFASKFRDMLEHDKAILETLHARWEHVTQDPKFELFRQQLETQLMRPQLNLSGKLVVFSESVDTLTYLYERITREMGRTDVLLVTAGNRKRLTEAIQHNFDANYPTDAGRYHILLTSDVLAEGVNLHRAHVIVNYDSPWNATRLIQRVGRVNRVGSVAPSIYNYLFYPSRQGNNEIQLYQNALVKLQGFHSAFGEDAQIFSREEIVREFTLFDSNVRDSVDQKIELLRELRELYNSDRDRYRRIQKLPLKSRVIRHTDHPDGESVVFISSAVKTEFYRVGASGAEAIDFLEAVEMLRAPRDEKPVGGPCPELHYRHVQRALQQYIAEYTRDADDTSIHNDTMDNLSRYAHRFLRDLLHAFPHDPSLCQQCDRLRHLLRKGTYARLPRRLKHLAQHYRTNQSLINQDLDRLRKELDALVEEYYSPETDDTAPRALLEPQIVLSETFV